VRNAADCPAQFGNNDIYGGTYGPHTPNDRRPLGVTSAESAALLYLGRWWGCVAHMRIHRTPSTPGPGW
jgi:hypothetical protein